MAELRACPFCGAVPYDVHEGGDAWFVGAQHADDCHFADFSFTREEAYARWNKRPEPESNLFLDLGFAPAEAAVLLAKSQLIAALYLAHDRAGTIAPQYAHPANLSLDQLYADAVAAGVSVSLIT